MLIQGIHASLAISCYYPNDLYIYRERLLMQGVEGAIDLSMGDPAEGVTSKITAPHLSQCVAYTAGSVIVF